MSDILKLQNGSDIRGVAMENNGEKVNLTNEIAYKIARSFGRYIKNKYPNENKYTSTVGTDSRLTGPAIKQAVINALIDEGFLVYDAALTSTPAIFMSTLFEEIKSDCGIMITASHLPYNRNGMKFFSKEGGLDKFDIKNNRQRSLSW